MALHSASVVGGRLTDWTTRCTDCHDPHFQAQLQATANDPDRLYLVQGDIVDLQVDDSDPNQVRSLLTYANASALPAGENPATWAAKSGPGRGLILVSNRDRPAATYEVLAADATTITVAGDVLATGFGSRFGLLYGQLIRGHIHTPTGELRPVDFFSPTDGLVDTAATPPAGICQVCHTRTTAWTADGNNPSHHPGIRCTACHPATGGFRATAYTHPSLPSSLDCTACHPGSNEEVVSAVHGNNCGACHQSPRTTVAEAITAASADCTTCHGAHHNGSPPPPPAQVTLTATPPEIAAGQSATLSWSTSNADLAIMAPGIGSVPLTGTLTVTPGQTTTYTLTAFGPGSPATARVRVMVHSTPAPPPPGSFAEQYQDVIPADATVAAYEPRRFAVVTGQVLDQWQQPLAGVAVTILDHPEYGTAFSDDSGTFTTAVEGGGTVVLTYQRQGYFETHRRLLVEWGAIARAPTVVMTPPDPKATTVTLDGNPDSLFSHRGALADDQAGMRSITTVLTGDTRAYAVDAAGNTLGELTTLTLRATEYSTPAAMPAVLPPTSAFTYCVELSVDGVERVQFDKPVTNWVENFLGFPVGVVVPVGYYDRTKGEWLPAANGVVVRLLDQDYDGVVDALDSDGDGQADDLDQDGLYDDEVAGLQDATLYKPGSTYWRFAISHFTPIDCNWPISFPPGWQPPNPKGGPNADQADSNEEDAPCTTTGSFVKHISRTLHEDIPIAGTDLTLHYASSRAQGARTTVTIPASGYTVPANLRRIIVRMDAGGRRFEQVLPAGPNQQAAFTWDGRDFDGRPLGTVRARITVGFAYQPLYGVRFAAASSDSSPVFGLPGTTASVVPGRQEIVSWRTGSLTLTAPQNAPAVDSWLLAPGWTLSSHHHVDPRNTSLLHKGDGMTASRTFTRIRKDLAGTGTQGYSGDGGPADQAAFSYSRGIAVDARGNVFFSDTPSNCIRKIDTNGIITTVAGQPYGGAGFGGDGGPATTARLNRPEGLAVDRQGNLYIADYYNYRIRKVDPSGTITTIAGTGASGYAGDGGPAILAQVEPQALAVDQHGNLLVADRNSCLRRIDTNGIITTVAGRCGSGDYYDPASDGALATEVLLGDITGIAVDTAGNLYLADRSNEVIRKVDPSGIITTIAGVSGYTPPNQGNGGDNDPATSVHLDQPYGVTADNEGNVYIAEYNGGRIRKVDTNGIISTVSSAFQSMPYALATDAIGNVYLAKGAQSRPNYIRKIVFPALYADHATSDDILFSEEDGTGHVFASNGRHLATIDLDTGVTIRSFTYDASGRLTAVVDQFGNQLTVERDPNGVPTALVASDGQRTNLTIDQADNLSRVTQPDGSHYDFAYTAGGLMTEKTEPNGNRFGHQFDDAGKLTAVTDQEGGHWTLQRQTNADGAVLATVTTAEGDQTSHRRTKDGAGRLTLTTDPAGGTASTFLAADGLNQTDSMSCGMERQRRYTVDEDRFARFLAEETLTTPAGLTRQRTRNRTATDTNADLVPDLFTETVTVNGNTTTLRNDTLAGRLTVTSPAGRVATTDYDPPTLLIASLTLPGRTPVTFTHDTRGRITAINQGTRSLAVTYGSDGLPATMSDALGHQTLYAYDANGRPTRVTRPDGSATTFSYDANGNITALVTANGVSHTFTANAVNRPASYTTPLSGSYVFSYDKDRRPRLLTMPSGAQFSYQYTNGRLSRIQTPEGDIDLTHLCSGRLASISNAGETISYTYDGALLIGDNRTGTVNQDLAATFDNDFRPIAFTYAGATTTYTHDADGLPISAGSFTITRAPASGLPIAISDGTFEQTQTFNGYAEPTSQTTRVNGQQLATWTLTRDDAGRISQRTEDIVGTTATLDYEYDANGRLLKVYRDGILVEEYRYGTNNARTYEMNLDRGISGRTYSYSAEDHLLTAGDTTYLFDADGFLTARATPHGTTTFQYSRRGELLRVDLTDGRVIEYSYDPLGRRIAKKVDGVLTEKYLWQGMTRLLAVYDNADQLLMRFQYAGGRLPAAVTMAGSTAYLVYDPVGTPRLLLDQAGTILKRRDSDAFGNITSDSNPTLDLPIGFAGGLYDPDTGLVRFGFRDYDPQTGRWTAKDPIFFAGGDSNLYGYVQNDPVNFVDPWGLAWSNIPGGVKNAFSGAANSLKDIAVNGPPEAKDLMAFAAATEVVPLTIATAQSGPVTAAAAQLVPYLPAMLDFVEDFLPGPPSTALGVGGAVTKGILENIWDSINDTLNNNDNPYP